MQGFFVIKIGGKDGMKIDTHELTDILAKFSGQLLDVSNGPRSKRFSLSYFVQNTIPYFHADIPFEAADIYQNYKDHLDIKGASFNAYLYYNLIKTMQQPEFEFMRYRYINDDWYVFENLPFFISVVLQKQDKQFSIFIENVGQMTWHEFVAAYDNQISNVRESESGTTINSDAWFVLAYQITTMPFVFASYTPAYKCPEHDAHSPWFVISKRYKENDKTHFMLSCTVSHASCSPSQLHAFLKAFRKNLLSK